MTKKTKTKTKKTKKPGGNGAQQPGGNGAQQPDLTYYNEAVAEAKQHIEAKKYHEMKVGELADGVESKYDEQTLQRFAKDIGYSLASLSKWRSMYRAYKNTIQEIQETSPKITAGVLQACQGLPEPVRNKLLKEKPNLTVREARTYARDYRIGQGIPEPAQEPAQVIEVRRWCDPFTKHALAIVQQGLPSRGHLDLATLRQALGDKLEETTATWREGSAVLNAWADAFECASPMFDDPTQTKH
jgi:hypothetical protein